MSIRSMLLTLAAVVAAGSAAMADPLITDEEGKLPLAPLAPKQRGISRGPSIKLDVPDSVPAHKPFYFKVEFEPHGRATIDPAKVRLTYLKMPDVDLTARIRPFTSAHGIDFPAAEVPPGQHPVRIEVEDSNGRTSQATIMLVADP